MLLHSSLLILTGVLAASGLVALVMITAAWRGGRHANERWGLTPLAEEILEDPLDVSITLDANPDACYGCGCTDSMACPGGCYWVAPNLCSTCAPPAPIEDPEDHSLESDLDRVVRGAVLNGGLKVPS
jgi:hypothetical protein